MSHVGAQCRDLGGGSEAAPQQAEAVELLNPLAVRHIALAVERVLDVTSVDQQDLDPARLEDLVERDPVDPGRFHRHRLDPARLEPVGRIEIAGEGMELPDGLGIGIFGDRDPMDLGSNVDPGSMPVDPIECAVSLRSRRWLALHRMLLHDAVVHPGTGALVEGVLLNGITQSVSPMMFSLRSWATLTNGIESPLPIRPLSSDAPGTPNRHLAPGFSPDDPGFRPRSGAG
jgi:hypothetical protein